MINKPIIVITAITIEFEFMELNVNRLRDILEKWSLVKSKNQKSTGIYTI